MNAIIVTYSMQPTNCTAHSQGFDYYISNKRLKCDLYVQIGSVCQFFLSLSLSLTLFRETNFCVKRVPTFENGCMKARSCACLSFKQTVIIVPSKRKEKHLHEIWESCHNVHFWMCYCVDKLYFVFFFAVKIIPHLASG